MSDPAASSGSGARKWVMFGLRLAVTGALIAWVLTQARVAEVIDRLASIHVGVWLLGLLIATAAQGLQVINLRWTLHRVIDATATDGTDPPRVPVFVATRAHALGVFANLFLPSAIGGDVLKTVALRRETDGVMAAAGAVVLARAIGVLGLVLTAALGLAMTWDQLATVPGLRPAFAIALGGLFVAMAVGWFGRRGFVRIGRRLCPERLKPKLTPVFDTIERLTLPAVVFPAAIGMAYSLCAAAWNGVFGTALGLNLDMWVYAFAVPSVYLVTLLPITVQGIGLREVTYVQVLAAFAISEDPAVAFSLLVFSAPLFVGLACGLFVAVTRTAADSASPSRPD